MRQNIGEMAPVFLLNARLLSNFLLIESSLGRKFSPSPNSFDWTKPTNNPITPAMLNIFWIFFLQSVWPQTTLLHKNLMSSPNDASTNLLIWTPMNVSTSSVFSDTEQGTKYSKPVQVCQIGTLFVYFSRKLKLWHSPTKNNNKFQTIASVCA